MQQATTNSPEIAQPVFEYGFFFKSTTEAGEIAKTEVCVYSNKEIMIHQIVLSFDNEPSSGFKVVRKFKNKYLLIRSIAYKEKSFNTIVAGLIKRNYFSQIIFSKNG